MQNESIRAFNKSIDLISVSNRYVYQSKLTPVLDGISENFDQHAINQIVLWKVDRYFEVNERVLSMLNNCISLRNGEHRTVEQLLYKMLEIQGVDISMASTMLRFRNPEVFQIIDRRAFRVVYGKPLKLYFKSPTAKKINIYFEYLDRLNEIAVENQIDFKILDRALYQLDIEINSNIKL